MYCVLLTLLPVFLYYIIKNLMGATQGFRRGKEGTQICLCPHIYINRDITNVPTVTNLQFHYMNTAVVIVWKFEA